MKWAKNMPTFEQEWVSPILEVYKKKKIEDSYTVILGLNPLGQALCRYLYEKNHFETVLILNSPAFSTWNRYPVDVKAPVVRNVPTRFVVSMVTHEGPTCGQVLSKKGNHLLKRMEIPIGRADYYDGITAPLISAGYVAGLDPVVLFMEETQDQNLILQIGDVSVSQTEVNLALEILDKGLDMNLSY